MSNLNVIILAAGIGKRMMSLTKNCPKPLLSVAGKPIIAHMIEFVRSVGAEKIIVVGGYYFQKLKKEIAIIGVAEISFNFFNSSIIVRPSKIAGPSIFFN